MIVVSNTCKDVHDLASFSKRKNLKARKTEMIPVLFPVCEILGSPSTPNSIRDVVTIKASDANATYQTAK